MSQFHPSRYRRRCARAGAKALHRVRGSRRRPGSILLAVTIVLALLALAAYGFADMMILDAQATQAYGRTVQASMATDSGLEYLSSIVEDRTANSAMFYNDPAQFQGVLVMDGGTPSSRMRFSVVAPLEGAPAAVRFGLIDESAKLNVNVIPKLNLNNQASRQMLMYLPNMTAEIADAILDWVDTDSTKRDSGVESEYYSSLSPAYMPTNGPAASLDELLLVKGVTKELLFGEDANFNGMLDANENDSDASMPMDNGDGILDLGWSKFLTVSSRELNRRADGTEKINLNATQLTALYDQLNTELGADVALFVCAFRVNGGQSSSNGGGGSSGGSSSGGQGGGSSQGGSQGGGSGGGNSGGGSSGGGGGSNGGGRGSSGGSSGGGGSSAGGSGGSSGGSSSGGSSGTSRTRNARTSGNSSAPAPPSNTNQASAAQTQAQGGNQPIYRGGLDVSGSGPNQIQSLYDLIGSTVQATVNQQSQTLTSPWSSDPSSLRTVMPQLEDKLTTTTSEYILGRINIAQAPYEVIMGIPNMDAQTANLIVSSQASLTSASSTGQQQPSTSFLMSGGQMTLQQMQTIGPYVTARGDVYRAQIVSHADDAGPLTRIEAIIDGSMRPARPIFVRDLTALGRGYPAQLLAPDAQ